MSLSDSFPDPVSDGLLLELDNVHQEALDPTNPFSSSFIERRLGNHSECSDKTNPFPSNYVEARIAAAAEHEDVRTPRQNYPIWSLQSDHLDCRLLFQPGEDDDLMIPDATSLTLYPMGLQAESNQSIRGVQCLSVRESPHHTTCRITKPIFCDIYFDPYQDSVLVYNNSQLSLQMTPSKPRQPDLPDARCAESQSDHTITIAEASRKALPTGSWVFTQVDNTSCSFQVLVFPRKRVIEVITFAMRPIAGSKRSATGEEASAVQRAPMPKDMAKRLNGVSELANGELARFYTLDSANEPEFTIYRMRRLGETNSAVVFQARHSDHSKQLIVVKVFKQGSGRDVVARATSWQNELKVHVGLVSEHIVKLLGGDARMHALYLEHIDARDLCHGTWCDYITDKKFRGSIEDARCIMYDMARALRYLRSQKILHNDIKPGNILFNGTKAILIDFGLATWDSSSACSGGTPWYVPPEYLGSLQRKAPSDVWALGVVMLYALRQIKLPDTGRDVPSWIIKDVGVFDSPAYKQMERWLDLVKGKAKHLASSSDEFGGFVAQMLDEDPADRITADNLVIVAKPTNSLVQAHGSS